MAGIPPKTHKRRVISNNNPQHESSALIETEVWTEAVKILALNFGLINRDLSRMRSEVPVVKRAAADACLARNLQVVSTEILVFLQKTWLAAKGGPNPDIGVGRYRELLSITHPARPINPRLLNTHEVRNKQAQLLKAFKEAVGPTAKLDAQRELQLLTRHQDLCGAELLAPHENLGPLAALRGLLLTCRDAGSMSTDIDVVSQRIASVHEKLKTNYLAALESFARIDPSIAPEGPAKLATIMQNIGLLRLSVRNAMGGDNADPIDVARTTDGRWQTYHGLIKQVCWFFALTNATQDELSTLSKDVTRAKGLIGEHLPTPIIELDKILDATTANLQQQINHAINNQPILIKYRKESAEITGKIVSAALAYTVGAEASKAFEMVRKSSAFLHAGDYIMKQLQLLSDTHPKLSTLADSVLGDYDKNVLSKRNSGFAQSIITSLTSTGFISLIPSVARRFLTLPHKSHSSIIDNATNHFHDCGLYLARTAMREMVSHHPDILLTHGQDLLIVADFCHRIESLQKNIRIYATFPADQREKWWQEYLRETGAEAAKEAAFNRHIGLDISSANRRVRFYHSRKAIIHHVTECLVDDLRRGQCMPEQRYISDAYRFYDRSSRDEQVLSRVAVEDQHAYSFSIEGIPHFRVGKYYYPDPLFPSYHARSSAIGAMFSLPRGYTEEHRSFLTTLLRLSRNPDFFNELTATIKVACVKHQPKTTPTPNADIVPTT